MRLPKMLLISFLFLVNQSFAENDANFRTPAKMYGRAYSVKLSLKRKGFEYVVPVWVKPDQKESSLDKSLLSDMGWVYADLKAEEASISGERIEQLIFKNQKSDWAAPPRFKKICCYGVIGQDILKDFEVRFDPRPPAHLEWTRIVHHGVSDAKKTKIFADMTKLLFSIQSETFNLKGEKMDLSKTPFTFNWSAKELEFEGLKSKL